MHSTIHLILTVILLSSHSYMLIIITVILKHAYHYIFIHEYHDTYMVKGIRWIVELLGRVYIHVVKGAVMRIKATVFR